MPPSMEAQTIRIRGITHLVSCPLCGIKYRSLLLQHCQTQFQSFSSAKSSCIFSGSDSRSRCGQETEPRRSQCDWRISTSQCNISKSAISPWKRQQGEKTTVRAQFCQLLRIEASINSLIKETHLKACSYEIKDVDLNLLLLIWSSCQHALVAKSSVLLTHWESDHESVLTISHQAERRTWVNYDTARGHSSGHRFSSRGNTGIVMIRMLKASESIYYPFFFHWLLIYLGVEREKKPSGLRLRW